MKTTIFAAGTVLVGSAVLAGCGGSTNTPNVDISIGSAGVSASASGLGAGSTDLSGPCQDLKKTISNIPGQLTQAATSNDPTKQVPQTISNIGDELKNDVSGSSQELQDAVQSYIDKLQQAGTTIANGKMPDLSQLTTTQIDNICTSNGGTAVGGNVATDSVTPSASASS